MVQYNLTTLNMGTRERNSLTITLDFSWNGSGNGNLRCLKTAERLKISILACHFEVLTGPLKVQVKGEM